MESHRVLTFDERLRGLSPLSMPRCGPVLRVSVCAGVALSVGIATLAFAHNPRITLRLDRVTASVAVTRLSRAAGVPLRLLTGIEGSEDEAEDRRAGGVRRSFNWRSISFGEALRDVREAWKLNIGQHIDRGYLLSFSRGPKIDKPRLAACSGEGYKIEVEPADVRERLAPPNYTTVEGFDAGLKILVRRTGIDADRSAYIGQLRLLEEGRSVFEQQAGVSVINRPFGMAYGPDEFHMQVYLNGSRAPRGRRLTLEGVVYEYRTFERSRLEVSLSGNGRTATSEAGNGDVRLTFVSYTPQPHKPVTNGPKGPIVRCRIAQRANSTTIGDVAWGMGFTPQLVTAQGTPISSHYSEDPFARKAPGGDGHYFPGDWSEGDFAVQERVCGYPRLDERPARLRLWVIRKADPQPAFRFRVEDVPVELKAATEPKPAP